MVNSRFDSDSDSAYSAESETREIDVSSDDEKREEPVVEEENRDDENEEDNEKEVSNKEKKKNSTNDTKANSQRKSKRSFFKRKSSAKKEPKEEEEEEKEVIKTKTKTKKKKDKDNSNSNSNEDDDDDDNKTNEDEETTYEVSDEYDNMLDGNDNITNSNNKNKSQRNSARKARSQRKSTTTINNNNSSSNNVGGSSSGKPRSVTNKRASVAISERLHKEVNNIKPELNRSPELIPLTQEYEKLRKQFKILISKLKTYQEAIYAFEEARTDMFEHVATMTEFTPLHAHVGQKKGANKLQTLQKSFASANGNLIAYGEKGDVSMKSGSNNTTDVSGNDVLSDIKNCSLLLLNQIDTKQNHILAKEYHTNIFQYVVQWEQVITTRVDEELRQIKTLKQDRTHYERKVESLRKKIREIEEKGKKSPSPKDIEKLERNEIKLKEAYELHETSAAKLCTLLEEVIISSRDVMPNNSSSSNSEHNNDNNDGGGDDSNNSNSNNNVTATSKKDGSLRRGWKDMYPFIKNLMTYEANRSCIENQIYNITLRTSMDNMKETFTKHSIRYRRRNSGKGKKVN